MTTTITKQHTPAKIYIYVQIIIAKCDNKQMQNYLKQERQEEN